MINTYVNRKVLFIELTVSRLTIVALGALENVNPTSLA